MLTTAQLRKEYGPKCASSTVTLNLNGEGRVSVAKVAADAFRALNQCLTVNRYRTRRADTGGFNCRIITGGTGVSLHGMAIAVDLNWTTNQYGVRLVTDMPTAMVGAILAIRTVSGLQVFGWGGNYRSVKDAMHFEIVCPLADLRSGINWATVPKLPASPVAVPFSWVPVKVVHQGDRSSATAALQFTLNCLTAFHQKPSLNITTPPGYGPITVATVKAFQKFARSMQLLSGEKSEKNLIDVDGTWGPQTGNAARFWIPNAIALANSKK